MTFVVKKASDWNYEQIIKLNTLEELKTYVENVGGNGIIIEKLDKDGDFENDISSVDMKITIYDDYIE